MDQKDIDEFRQFYLKHVDRGSVTDLLVSDISRDDLNINLNIEEESSETSRRSIEIQTLTFPAGEVHSDANALCCGTTPLVQLKRFCKENDIDCQIHAKCEFMHQSGTAKAREAYKMIQNAEDKKLIKEGWTIISPNSGTFAVAMAQACTIKDYRFIAVLEETVSNAKINLIKVFGGLIVRTPNDLPRENAESPRNVALKLAQLIPDSIVLDPWTPDSLSFPVQVYQELVDEIVAQFVYPPDMIVCGDETGLMVTGITKAMHKIDDTVIIVGVEPKGSSMSLMEFKEDESLVQDIGNSSLSQLLNESFLDQWYQIDDTVSFQLARQIHKLEGLKVSPSSGTVLGGAIKAIENLGMKEHSHCKICVIFNDSLDMVFEEDISFIHDSWILQLQSNFDSNKMTNKKWDQNDWWKMAVNNDWCQTVTKGNVTMRVHDALELMYATGVEKMVILDKIDNIVGVTTVENLENLMSEGHLNQESTLSMPNCIYKSFYKIFLEEEKEMPFIEEVLSKVRFAIIIFKDTVKVPITRYIPEFVNASTSTNSAFIENFSIENLRIARKESLTLINFNPSTSLNPNDRDTDLPAFDNLINAKNPSQSTINYANDSIPNNSKNFEVRKVEKILGLLSWTDIFEFFKKSQNLPHSSKDIKF